MDDDGAFLPGGDRGIKYVWKDEGSDAALPEPSTTRGGFRKVFGPPLSKAKDGFSSFMLKASPARFRSPQSIANEIRRICRHDDSNIFERHKATDEMHVVSDRDKVLLKALCRKLLTLVIASNNRETQIAALRRYTSLSINDPKLRGVFHSVIFDSTTDGKPLELQPEPIEIAELHENWSDFITLRVFKRNDQAKEKLCDDLKRTICMRLETPTARADVLASKYLSYALELELTGQELDFLFKLWVQFLEALSKRRDHGGWDVLETCTKNILSSGKPLEIFFSPFLLTMHDFPKHLLRHRNDVPSIFDKLFRKPELWCHARTGKRCFYYEPMGSWNLRQVSSYGSRFVNSICHLDSARSVDFTAMEELHSKFVTSNLVFGSRPWMLFYHVSYYAFSNYYYGRGFSNDMINARCLAKLVEMCVFNLPPVRFGSRATYAEDQMLPAYHISQAVGVDRYCKRSILEMLRDNTTAINLVIYHSQVGLWEHFQTSGRLSDLACIHLFENVPYLRRYKINGSYFITSDNIPVLPFDSTLLNRRNFVVDVMPLNGHSIVCLRVNADDPLDFTGHYPILAGHDASRKSLYLAAVRLDHIWYFTCVSEGEDTVVYTDELGETHYTGEFFVLALRHDPSDMPPPYPPVRKGAMDPTGPLFWIRFWPVKDVEYVSLKKQIRRLRDEDILVSFLNDYFDRSERDLLSGFSQSYVSL